MKIAGIVTVIVFCVLLPFQNCGQKFKTDLQVVEVQSNEGEVPVLDPTETVVSKTYSVSIWKDMPPVQVSILEKIKTETKNTVTVFRFKNFPQAQSTLDIESESFSGYKNFNPRVYDLKTTPQEASQIYLLNDLGTKLANIHITPMVAEIDWEVDLVEKATAQDLVDSQRSIAGVAEVIRLGRNKIQWTDGKIPLVERTLDCTSLQHLENDVCVSNTKSCPIPNGTGQQVYANNMWSDTCTLVTCNAGYGAKNGACVLNPPTCTSVQHLENNICVSNTRSCPVVNGTGQQSWVNTMWSTTCTPTMCNSGYTLTSGQCVQDPQCTSTQHRENNICVSNTRSCPISNGTGQQVWANNMWSAECTLLSCNSGFVANGGVCVANTPVPPATPTCTATQHLENNLCVSNTRSCPVTNGTGQQVWTNAMWSTACTIVSCNSGFVASNGSCVASTPLPPTTPTCTTSQHLENNVCVSNTKSCSIGNGVGEQIWQSKVWKACKAVSCNPGAFLLNGACVQPLGNNQGVFVGRPSAMTLVPSQNAIYLVESVNRSLIKVDLTTGYRTLLSGFARGTSLLLGSGPEVNSGSAIALSPDAKLAVIAGRSSSVNYPQLTNMSSYSMIKIDLVTGERKILSSFDYPNIGITSGVRKIAFGPMSGLVYVRENYGSFQQETSCLKTVDLSTGVAKAVSGVCDGAANRGVGGDMRPYTESFHITSDEKFAYFFKHDGILKVDLTTGDRTALSLAGVGFWLPAYDSLEADEANSTVTLLVQRKISSDGTSRPALVKINYQTRTTTLVEQYNNMLVTTSDDNLNYLGGAPFAVQLNQKNVFLFDNLLSLQRYNFANLATAGATKTTLSNNRVGGGAVSTIQGSLALNLTGEKLFATGNGTTLGGGADLDILEIDVKSGQRRVLSRCENLGIPAAVNYKVHFGHSINKLVVHPITGEIFIGVEERWHSPYPTLKTGTYVGAIYKVNPADGKCSIVSGRTSTSARRGAGDFFLVPEGITMDPQGENIYLVAQTLSTNYATLNSKTQMIKVNLQTGDRTSLFDETYMTAPWVSVDGKTVFALLPNSFMNNLVKYDLSSSTKAFLPKVISPLQDSANIPLDTQNIYATTDAGVLKMDLGTGSYDFVSSVVVGNGPTFETAVEVVYKPSTNSIFVLGELETIYEMNLNTGVRTLISK